MFLKKRKSLFVLFVAFFAAVLLCAGAALLSAERQKAYAASGVGRIYWEIDGTTLTLSGQITDVSDSTKYFDYEQSFSYEGIPWSSGRSTVTQVTIKNGVAPVSTEYWFYGFEKLTEIDFSGLDTSNTSYMSGMFYNCSAITELDFPVSFDTSNVTDMSGMFADCTELAYVDLSNFDMTNCTSRSMIFSGCAALKKAKLSASFAASGAIFNAPADYWYSEDGVEYNSDSDPKMSAAGTYYAEGNYHVNVSYDGGTENYYGIAKAWEAANDAGTATVTMLADAEAGATLTVAAGKNITLDLNGFMLKLKAGVEGSVIEVNGTFTLTDGYDGTDRKHDVLNVVSEAAGDTVRITGGVITGGNATWGGGVSVNRGSFIMNGGTIAGNSASICGGVYVDLGTFKMLKGVISYNLTNAGGGGAYIVDDGEFIMNGGTISNNGSNMGSVCVMGGTFTMNDGTISGNTTRYYGGGVYVVNSDQRAGESKFIMNGGKISGNSSTNGGGVYVNDGADFVMSANAEISGNTATHDGGGVYVYYGDFTMNGGTISGNDAESGGGLYVWLAQNGKCTLTGGEISNNTISERKGDGYTETGDGGGVYVYINTDVRTEEKFCISGVINITGNKKTETAEDNETRESDDNLYMHVGIIDVKGALKDESGNVAQIGITIDGVYGVFTRGYGEHNKSGESVVPAGAYFISDTAWCIRLSGNEAAALAHEYEEEFTVDQAATCTENGSKSRHCKYCDARSYVTEIEAEHTYNGWQILTPATCTTEGVLKGVCAVCGHDEIGAYSDPDAHNWVVGEILTQPTCTAEGLANYTCSHNSEHTKTDKVAALGHDFADEFTTDTAATCTQAGSQSKHCSRCEEKTEVTPIPALGHDLTHHAATAATADKAGNTEYWSCGECEKYFSDGEGVTEIADKSSVEIPKLTPVDPSEPVDPSMPVDPSEPVDPSNPEGPSTPADPSTPGNPSTPADTTKPADTQKKKSYVWICWLLIPLAFAGGGVAVGVWLYGKGKKK